MDTPSSRREQESTEIIIIGPESHLVIDETVRRIDFIMSSELQEKWPELATSFTVTKGRLFYHLTEIDDEKEEHELVTIRHRKGKEITVKNFLETDMMRGEREKKAAMAAGIFGVAAGVAITAATAALKVRRHKRSE
jgi:hypothetical protein